MYTLGACEDDADVASVCVCACACMYVCMYVCAYVHACMYEAVCVYLPDEAVCVYVSQEPHGALRAC